MFTNMMLKSFNSIVTDDEPELEGPESPTEGDLPVPVVDDLPRVAGAVAQVGRQDVTGEVLARASGHRHLGDFSIDDLTTFNYDMARLTGVPFGGVKS